MRAGFAAAIALSFATAATAEPEVDSGKVPPVIAEGFQAPFRLTADGGIIDLTSHTAPFVYDFDGDGVDDLLVGHFGDIRAEWDQVRVGHAFMQGRCNIYLNKGTREAPRYTYGGQLMSGDKPAYVPTDCCVGFTPWVADLDGDGIDDILSGSYPGLVYFSRGLGKGGYAPQQLLRDAAGKALNPGKSMSVSTVDWDGDGDLDLLFGLRYTDPQLSLNQGGQGIPVFTPPQPIGLARFDRAWYVSNIVPFDWDGDGLFDLLGGSESGSVYYYRQLPAGDGQRTFAPAIALIQVPLSPDAVVSEDDIRPHGSRTKIQVRDYNHDGKPDILLGDIFFAYRANPDAVSPQPDNRWQRMNELMKRNEPMLSRVSAFVGEQVVRIRAQDPDLPEDMARGMAYGRLPDGLMAAYGAYSAEYRDVVARLTAQDPRLSFVHGFVWVYLQK